MRDDLSGWDRACMDCMGATGMAGGVAGAVAGGYVGGPFGVLLGGLAGLLGGAVAGKSYCPGWADRNQWDYYNPPLPPDNPPPPEQPAGMNDFPFTVTVHSIEIPEINARSPQYRHSCSRNGNRCRTCINVVSI
jgi:hypothetical protein